MIYNVGDTVKIRTGLIVGSAYGSCEFIAEMQKIEGCTATISEVISDQDQYKIDVDGSKYFWHSSMFELTSYQKIIKLLSL